MLEKMTEPGFEDYSFEKVLSETYRFRFSNSGWANITINESLGSFECQSDYGNYSYRWSGSYGKETFKQFLIGILSKQDLDYFLNKIADRTYVNFEKQINAWKLEAEEYSEDSSYTEILEALDGLEYTTSSSELASQLYYLSVDESCLGDYFSVDAEYSPQVMNFTKLVIPAFVEILKKETDSL